MKAASKCDTGKDSVQQTDACYVEVAEVAFSRHWLLPIALAAARLKACKETLIPYFDYQHITSSSSTPHSLTLPVHDFFPFEAALKISSTFRAPPPARDALAVWLEDPKSS